MARTPQQGAFEMSAQARATESQRWWWTANAMFLFACVSMYFGTGWSLLLFSFPIASELTPATYYLQLVPQFQAATHFFTYMTIAMLVSGAGMTYAEWKTGYRWIPLTVLVAVIAATWLTRQFIFPLNAQMSTGIGDQATLNDVLAPWMSFNRIRVWLWTVQWVAMAIYFALKASRAPLRRGVLA
jgi:hypothetical protein